MPTTRDGVTRYTLAKFFIGDEEITAESLDISNSVDVTQNYGSNSKDPYSISFGQREGTFEFSNVDIKHKAFVREYMNAQYKSTVKLDDLSVYDFDEETGDVVEDNIYYEIWIDDESETSSNGEFGFSGGFRKKKN